LSDTKAQEKVVGILTPLSPWCGLESGTADNPLEAEVKAATPWASPENEQKKPENQKNSKHPSVVIPRSEYDVYAE
jgi:hypothetical protein